VTKRRTVRLHSGRDARRRLVKWIRAMAPFREFADTDAGLNRYKMLDEPFSRGLRCGIETGDIGIEVAGTAG
jgi:hypothetical protein